MNGLAKINSAEEQSFSLSRDLRQFTGTEHWYRHNLVRGMLYTDGVQYFAEHAGAYWFLDIVATEIFPLQDLHPFMKVTLLAEDNKGTIIADDGNGEPVFVKEVEYTDCPMGGWDFYLTDNVFLLPSEY
jgi:hypothetical protein